MGNSDRVGRMKAAAMPATRDLLRVEERKVEARQRMRTDYVASPNNRGTRNMVQRVVNSLDFLWTRGKLNEHEYNAALRYQAAWECIHSSIGGQIDFERARGGGMPGGSLASAHLAAAGTIKEARKVLGEEEFAIVHRVVALNYAILDVADKLGRNRKTISAHLKKALSKLVDFWELGKCWEGVERRRRVYAHRGFDPRQMRSTEGNVPRAKVAHADRRGVRYKG